MTDVGDLPARVKQAELEAGYSSLYVYIPYLFPICNV
jgi:hypothetical protein